MRYKFCTRTFAAPSPKAHDIIHSVHLIMLNRKMSMSELSVQSGVDRWTLINWWKGTHDPSLVKLDRVMRVLGYTLAGVPFDEQLEKLRVKIRIETARLG